MEEHGSGWTQKAKRNASWISIFGVVEIIAGIVVIASPGIGGVAVAVMIGVMFLLAGIARLVTAFMAGSFGAGALSFIWGIIVMMTGFYMLNNHGVTLATLTLVLSMILFGDGITRVIMGFQMKPASGWGWFAFGGALGILLAIMIWSQFPLSGVWAIGTLVGISLLFSGITTLTIGRAAKKTIS